jgi:predicted alpha/beta superfamily hydrolase
MIALVAFSLVAAPVDLARTERFEIVARSNDVRYDVRVALPRSFATSTRRFPLLLMLDADYSFPAAHAIVNHLTDRNRLPEQVVVAVGYPGADDRDTYRRERTRDYTPWHSADGGYGPEFQKLSGGGPRFLAFLEQELLPLLGTKYRTTGDRTLVGHSYGALFGAWVLARGDGAFRRFILVSPSLWYAERKLFAEGVSPRSAEVYLAVGAMEGGDHDMAGDLRRFYELVRTKTNATIEVWPEQNHDTVFPFALSNGLRFVWTKDGWGSKGLPQPPPVDPAVGR